MRRKLFLLGFLLSIMIMPSFAQIDDEIQQSKTEQVRKGREYLTEKFLDRDYEKVKEIKDYLLTFETEEFKAFKPHELWHILLWTQEYEALETAFRQVRLNRFIRKFCFWYSFRFYFSRNHIFQNDFY